MSTTHTATTHTITALDVMRICRCAVAAVEAFAMDLPTSLTAQQRHEVMGVIHGAVGTALMDFFEIDRGGIPEGTYQVLREEIDERLQQLEVGRG